MLSHTPLFKSHSLAIHDFSFETVTKPALWPILILCVIVFLLTIIMVTHRRQFSLLVQSFFSQRFYSLLTREGKILEEPFFALVLVEDVLIFAFTLQILLQHIAAPIFDKLHYMAVYGIIVVGLFLFYFIKLLINHIYTFLFDYKAESYPLNLIKFIFLTNLAISMVPFIIMGQFSHFNAAIFAVVPIFIILFLLYVYRLIILNHKKINLFQFFIYFCTLEILPYLLVVKSITMI